MIKVRLALLRYSAGPLSALRETKAGGYTSSVLFLKSRQIQQISLCV